MSSEDTKPGAIPVESAANEMDDAKKLEGSIDVVASTSNGNEESTAATTSAAVEKTASAQSEEAPKLSDSELEDKVVQDAVKQSASDVVPLSRRTSPC